MARVTILFSIVLVLLGLLGFMETGHRYPTSLIPVAVGILLGICGFLARTTDTKRRALVMHIAVTLGLLSFLATAKSIYDFILLQQHVQFAYPAAVEEKAAMAGLMLVYVVLCVRSFIQARRARTA